MENRHKKDYKSLLQEYVQKKYKAYPRYSVIRKTGPDHDKTFVIEVSINNVSYGKGVGKNKKQAEQQAAGIAYNTLTKKSATKKS